MAAEQIVTISATGATSVEIFTTKLDHAVENSLMVLPMARFKDITGNNNAIIGDSNIRIIDVGMVKESITITGYLVDDATSSGLTKKVNLMTLAKNYHTIKVTWGTVPKQQTLEGDILKVTITETAGIMTDGTATSTEKGFSVILTVAEGTQA